MPLTKFYPNIHPFYAYFPKLVIKLKIHHQNSSFFEPETSQKVQFSTQMGDFQKKLAISDPKRAVANHDRPSGGFLPFCHWHVICTSSQYFWEKLFVYLNDDIFGENNHQELLNEDTNRTERGFCGHGRIQVVNSRKIRAILRYFVNFVELHLFVIT